MKVPCLLDLEKKSLALEKNYTIPSSYAIVVENYNIPSYTYITYV